MSETQLAAISVEQIEGFRFQIVFSGTQAPVLVTDESPPLGEGAGPNPAALLAAAVANCLAASLLFALRKYKYDPYPITGYAEVEMRRNAVGRLRVGGMAVTLHMECEAAAGSLAERALAQFEDFCVVTQSVREGFPVSVVVRDPGERIVHRTETGM